MEVVKRIKQVEIDVYKTSDGKEFENRSDAEANEASLTGCPNCKEHAVTRVRERWITQSKPHFGENYWKTFCTSCDFVIAETDRVSVYIKSFEDKFEYSPD